MQMRVMLDFEYMLENRITRMGIFHSGFMMVLLHVLFVGSKSKLDLAEFMSSVSGITCVYAFLYA